MVAFIGIDLAWTPHHDSGVCIIDGTGRHARVEALTTVRESPDYFAELCAGGGQQVVAAIDAPLIVEPGRIAERELSRVYGRAKAGPYTASMDFLRSMNGLAGPMTAAALRTRGFSVVPSSLIAPVIGRVAVEVFPHPAHVELFGLRERLPYKKGRMADRRRAMAEYQGHLARLLNAEMPGVAADANVRTLLAKTALEARGRQFKALEDRLDALTCAVVAHHCWTYGAEGFRVFGDDATGAIVVPVRVTSSLARSSP